MPSENVEIKPISASKRVAATWETNQSYTQLIIELMRQMVSEQRPEGYAVIPLGEKLNQKTFIRPHYAIIDNLSW